MLGSQHLIVQGEARVLPNLILALRAEWIALFRLRFKGVDDGQDIHRFESHVHAYGRFLIQLDESLQPLENPVLFAAAEPYQALPACGWAPTWCQLIKATSPQV